MASRNGKDNEYEFVKNLNNKKLKELNPLLKSLIEGLFSNVNDATLIKCWLNHYPQKADIFVKINSQIKGISIKLGSKNSVHVEPITEFIHFLIENKVSKESVVEYLKYHYADGTTNGKGLNRISAEEYKKNHQEAIDKLNNELNRTELIWKAIYRFVLKGNNSNCSIDALIYGEVNDFFWLSKKEIINILLRDRNNYSTGVHFSNLSVQPMNRCLNHNIKYEKNRYSVQIKWFSLFDDIMKNYYYKNLEKINEVLPS